MSKNDIIYIEINNNETPPRITLFCPRGFANSMASSAMEYKPEGFILGVGANTFKLAGTVIVFGVFSAFIVASIKYLVWIL